MPSRSVSMESGLEDRNNRPGNLAGDVDRAVSMESGLEDRNNLTRSVCTSDSRVKSQWSPA